MNYLQFDFEMKNQQDLEQLIALLGDQGFEGFEEEGLTIKAYISETEFDESGFSAVLDLFSNISYVKNIIEHINWNKEWEEGFQPVVVDHFVAVRAGFHEPVAGVEHDIVITPKMSFGTGHHATTYLMIRQMKELNFSGKSVLDFGTGTGILAILAEKLGASNILAIDYDEWSIDNAKENISLNGCTAIEVGQMDTIPAGIKFDIILANINLNVIQSNMAAITSACNPGASILLSGFLKENETDMESLVLNSGLLFVATFQRGDWILILAEKTSLV